MAEWFVAKAADLPDGDRRIVTAGNNEIGVFHHGGTYYAYSNYCVHSGGPACEGILINQVVDLIAPDRTYQGQTFSDEVHFVCPWHGYEYELTTGQCVGDRKLKLKKFEVVRRGDDFTWSPEGENQWIRLRTKSASLTSTITRPQNISSTRRSRHAPATTRIF